MLSVLLVVMLVVAAVAVLAGVVAVAMGRGGELAFFQPDYAPLKLEEITSTDIALFRPPSAVWGYSMIATDEALTRIAAAVTERDVEIATLQQQVADLQSAVGRGGYGSAERAGRPDSTGFQGERAARQHDGRSAAQRGELPAQFGERPAERGARSAQRDERSAQYTARPVWEPNRPPGQEPTETLSSAGWAALPKRSPRSRGPAARDDEEDKP